VEMSTPSMVMLPLRASKNRNSANDSVDLPLPHVNSVSTCEG
jgi:hypothetical protein